MDVGGGEVPAGRGAGEEGGGAVGGDGELGCVEAGEGGGEGDGVGVGGWKEDFDCCGGGEG